MNFSPEMTQMLFSYGPIVFMVLAFYFMLYKPQKQEQAKRQEMLSNLKIGDNVVTLGGIYGVITKIADNTLEIKIADSVEIKIAKTAVNKVNVEE
ncbi:MAG: preprotein translocase subunit YajC [Negativicutes bacterium]|nr:preprotein translocase subunit YajC [Negativicutes bacterium]MBP9537234.1 preprotein translocase subunit YajC [Negativicutes bacterium]MBP9949525.1 preprotein translocase subunit YajC [Negativicutes bacterium]